MRPARATLCALLLATLAGEAAPADPPAPPAGRGMLVEGRTEAEQALLDALLPKPMSRERLSAFLATIAPGLEIGGQIEAAHALYLDRVRDATRAARTPVAGRVPAAFVFDPAEQSFEPRFTPALVELLAARADAAEAAARAEAVLVRSIESETPADARRRIPLALEAWRTESLPRRGLLASTETSVAALVARIPLEPTLEIGVGQVVAAHAARTADLLGERLALLGANELERARIETEAGPLWRLGPSSDERRALEARLSALDDRAYANEAALRDERLDAIRQLRLRLPATAGRRLVEAWQRAVHPELFDDERLLAELVEASIASTDIADDTRVLLVDTVEQGYRRLEPLAEKCCLAADLLEPRILDRSTFGVVAEIGARMALLEAQIRRRKVLRETFERVRIMLPAGDVAADNEVRRRRDAFVVTLDALDRADAFERDALSRLALEVAESGLRPESGATTPADGVSSGSSSIPVDGATPATDGVPPAEPRVSREDAAGSGSPRARGSRRPR